jgi:hypothetical protein
MALTSTNEFYEHANDINLTALNMMFMLLPAKLVAHNSKDSHSSHVFIINLKEYLILSRF